MKNTLISLTLILFSIIFALVIVEVVLRLASSESFRAHTPSIVYRVSDNPDRQYGFIPGVSGSASGTAAIINDHGHRGRMGQYGKFDGIRILAMGDSIIFGLNLTAEESHAARLHDTLNNGQQAYEVLNFGVPGYDILQELAYLEEIVEVYKPDYVVFSYCLNDVSIVSLDVKDIVGTYRHSLWYKSYALRFIYQESDKIYKRWFSEAQNDPNYFINKYKDKIAPIAEDEHELLELMDKTPDVYISSWYKNKNQVGRLRYAFTQLAALADKQDFQAAIAIIPFFMEADEGYPFSEIHKIVAMEAARARIDVIDLLDEFEPLGLENYKGEKNDNVHPGPGGHIIIANKLAQYYRLREQE
jgi:lysophospholipase L1-like esterase